MKRWRVPIICRFPSRDQPLPRRVQSTVQTFAWTADPNKIIAAVKRGHQVLNFYPLGPHLATPDQIRYPRPVRGIDRGESRKVIRNWLAQETTTFRHAQRCEF